MPHAWLQSYPPGMPAELPAFSYRSLADLLDEAFEAHKTAAAYLFMGTTLTFGAVDEASRSFAAYLQSLGLGKGDRVALMMPNVPQYPVAVAAVLRAGMVVVNTNPLYTPRELEHQLNDSGARAIVVLEPMAATVAACLSQTPVEHVVVARIGDMLPRLKGMAVDFAVRRIRKMVPRYDLPSAIGWRAALARGRRLAFVAPAIGLEDLAVLQYTGGTTGVAKGAMLSHRNLVSNALQSELWYAPGLSRIPASEQAMTVCALPLYHIFGFTVNMMLSMRVGGCNLLILNPRDIPAVIRQLRQTRFHCLPAVNTLFDAIARHKDAKRVDWSNLRLSLGGGMMVQETTAERWLALTGSVIHEGYGLSETSPSACCNPFGAENPVPHSIGLPLPSTEIRIIDDREAEMPRGEAGELAIRGPQVMQGYWRRPDETRRAMTRDGFLKTGDIGVMDSRGYFRIVDRKKDMINVSGFNVYPSEIEELVLHIPGILEAAAVSVPDDLSGEAVKLVLVRADDTVTEDMVRAFCRKNLTAYKRPRLIEFRRELPKTAVGKVLRRALRDQ